MLGARSNLVQVVNHVVDAIHVLNLLEPVCRLDDDLDGEDEASRAEAALRRGEELGVSVLAHAHDGGAGEREDEDEGAHVRRDHGVLDAAAVRGCADQAADRLVADAPDVAEGERGLGAGERGVDGVQRRARFEGRGLAGVRDLASALARGRSENCLLRQQGDSSRDGR